MAGKTSRFATGVYGMQLADGSWVHPVTQLNASGVVVNPGLAPFSASTVSIDAVVAVANTSTTVAAANANRVSVLIKNIDTQTVYLYTLGAATTGKFPLNPGQAITYRNQLAITGIVASGTANVYVIEEQR